MSRGVDFEALTETLTLSWPLERTGPWLVLMIRTLVLSVSLRPLVALSTGFFPADADIGIASSIAASPATINRRLNRFT